MEAARGMVALPIENAAIFVEMKARNTLSHRRIAERRLNPPFALRRKF
jgi:hypothetical protein